MTMKEITYSIKQRISWRLAILLLTFINVTSSFAVSKAEADSAYVDGNYQLAAQYYNELLEEGVSSELYFNLGNAYYRMNDITHSLIAYERALRLSPGDTDIRFNLQLARSKTVDKIAPEAELFFVTWYHAFVNLLSADGWSFFALGTLAFAILLALLYLFSSPIWLRKIGFFGGMSMMMLFLMANIFAWQQQSALTSHKDAIIIQSAVSVKSSPSLGSADLFLLHEGTKVKITDDSMENWKEIRISDGKQGWVEFSQIEII